MKFKSKRVAEMDDVARANSFSAHLVIYFFFFFSPSCLSEE